LSGHEVIIQPARGWSSLRLHELWEYRDLLYFMTMRQLQARYRQMALGPLWIIIQPLMSMLLYSLIFGRIAKLPSDGQPYMVFTLVALLPWGIFSDAVSSAANSLVNNKQLISKVYFPRLITILSDVLTSFVDFVIEFAILLVLMAAYGLTPTWGIVFVPVLVLCAAAAGVSVGLWFAGIIVQYHDFGQIAGVIVRFWMYATPVVYSMSLVPPEWRAWYQLNPMTGIVEGFRWALLGTSPPPDWTLPASLLLFVPLFIGGLYMFKRVERNIVDIA
jgi:lipopolysaccharide transport system permease protein